MSSHESSVRPRSRLGQEEPGEELERGQGDRDHDERCEVPGVIDHCVAGEEPGEGEPHANSGRDVQCEQDLFAGGTSLELRAEPRHQRTKPCHRQKPRQGQLDDVHRPPLPTASSSTTRSSETCRNSWYHCPTAEKGDGNASMRSSSASLFSRRRISGGATGTARITFDAPRARAHRRAAAAVPPVATPSSMTTATLPASSIGGRLPR